MLRVFVAAAVALSTYASKAPAQAGSDVHLLSLTRAGDSLRAGAPLNISANAGYDNQPSFTADGAAVLFSSVREGGQSDIYRYTIATRALTKLTGGPESEYSPLPVPAGNAFSVIRVERDSAQRLWQFPMAGGAPTVIFENIKPVGYHAWIGDTALALFVLGSPNTLQIASRASGTGRTVASSIGRSLHVIPGTTTISYVDKGSAQWWITSLNPATGERTRLVATPGRSEDIAWLDGNTILGSDGTRLLMSSRNSATGAFSEWRPFADLSSHGISGITRMAISRDGRSLAIVAAESR